MHHNLGHRNEDVHAIVAADFAASPSRILLVQTNSLHVFELHHKAECALSQALQQYLLLMLACSQLLSPAGRAKCFETHHGSSHQCDALCLHLQLCLAYH